MHIPALAAQCNTPLPPAWCLSVWSRAASRINTLHSSLPTSHVSTHVNTLQHSSLPRSTRVSSLQHSSPPSTRVNTLQHSSLPSTHVSTLHPSSPPSTRVKHSLSSQTASKFAASKSPSSSAPFQPTPSLLAASRIAHAVMQGATAAVRLWGVEQWKETEGGEALRALRNVASWCVCVSHG